jgi:hypothetical protein
MKKNHAYLFLAGAMLFSTVVSAQDAPPPAEEKEEEAKPTFTLAGSLDTYFHTSFKNTNEAYGGTYAPASAFADGRGFALGMANLIASYGNDKVGFTADLVFGPRGKGAVFNSEQGIVNQLYAYYKISDKVTFNLGQFNTFVGYEVISPTINFHYSTSYLFSYGPFNHTGLRADIDFGGGWGAKFAIMNPTDLVEFNPVDTYTFGLQLGKTSDAGGIWLNFLAGDQDGKLEESDPDGDGFSAGTLFQADLTTGWNLGETFYLGANVSYQTTAAGEELDLISGEVEDSEGDATSFFGVALYPKITISESFGIGVRAEYFAIKKNHLDIIGLDPGGDGDVIAVTLSANYKIGALTLIPEFRIDKTSENSFANKDGEAKDLLPTFNFAAVYKF